MSKSIQAIVYRYLTNADFFNIYKPRGTEARGGGQAYIDFPTKDISLANWERFLDGVHGIQRDNRAQGPAWTIPISSIGISNPSQHITIYQRRKQSVTIGSQKITSQRQNRLNAWHPNHGFPEPQNPTEREQLPYCVCIFLAKTYDNEIWAGWFGWTDDSPPSIGATDGANKLLHSVLDPARENGDAGILSFPNDELLLEPSNSTQPFFTADSQRRRADEEEVAETHFDEDEIELSQQMREPTLQTRVVQVRSRNTRAVKDLKELYGHVCQVTGEKYLFAKKDGTNYTEAHHLLPLGEGGADDPHNIVIISPLIHRMFHYADVSPIDLSNVVVQDDGFAQLSVSINGEPYTITWHPAHARIVQKYMDQE